MDADSKGERVGRGAATRGLGGAGIGALIGLTCGPFAVYCVPALAGGGAVAGGLGGAFHGLTGLDREEAERVNEVLDAIDRQRDFPLELERAVLSALPEEVRAEPGDAALSLVVSIQRLELERYVGEQLSLLIHAQVRLNVSGARHGQRERHFSAGKKRALLNPSGVMRARQPVLAGGCL